MGIKGLVSLFDTLGEMSVQMSFADLPPGTRICIDTPGFIYSSLMKNSQNHVTGILNLITTIFKYKLQPIFVFDGQPPTEKQFVLDERKRARAKAKEKLDDISIIISKFEDEMLGTISKLDDAEQAEIHHKINGLEIQSPDVNGTVDNGILAQCSGTEVTCPPQAGLELSVNGTPLSTVLFMQQDGFATPPELTQDIESSISIAQNLAELQQCLERERKKSIGLQNQQIQEIKQLLDIFGIPFIHTNKEADVICSKLVTYGFADYCLGNDMDILVYGCPHIIRNMSFRDDSFTLYSLDHILSNLRLTYDEFVDMCILMGCDYTPRLLGIKPVLAYELITQYHSIENIIANIEKINTDLNMVSPGKYIKFTPAFDFIKTRNVYSAQDITKDMISTLVGLGYSSIYNTCLLIVQNRHNYKCLLTFCKKHCHGLNTSLITKKIEIILTSVIPDQDINYIHHTIHPKSRRKLDF